MSFMEEGELIAVSFLLRVEVKVCMCIQLSQLESQCELHTCIIREFFCHECVPEVYSFPPLQVII